MGRKLSLGLLLLALVLGLGLWGWSEIRERLRPAAELVKEIPDNVEVDVSARGVTLSQGEAGRINWKLFAASAAYDQETGEAVLDNPEVTYRLDDGREITVAAPKGVVDRAEDTASLGPHVTANFGDARLTGKQLDYDGQSQSIEVSGDVVLERPDMILAAPVLVFSLETGNISARGGVALETTTPVQGDGKG